MKRESLKTYVTEYIVFNCFTLTLRDDSFHTVFRDLKLEAMDFKNTFIFIAMQLVLVLHEIKAEKGCAARQIANKSVVCVCTADYCDELKREVPQPGRFISYTSSKAGSRFKKYKGVLKLNGSNASKMIKLDPNTKFQKIEGFGAAITDSAGINWRSLRDPKLMQHLVDSYFGAHGIGYTYLRVPIGGTDFSTRLYSYNDLYEGDYLMEHFNLTYEDYEYKIPFIKAASAALKKPVRLIGSSWSPPQWMKSSTNYARCGRLLKKYYSTYADYHIKFMEKYAEEGIPLWALTTSNEPSNEFLNVPIINCMGWTSYQMGIWITDFFGPRIRMSKFNDVKILTVDDQRYTIPMMFNQMVEDHPSALDYIDGVAVHYYGDCAPTTLLQAVSDIYPDKFLIATEASEGLLPDGFPHVDLGSWNRGKNYALDIITDLNFKMVGWLDWNFCLNEQGGPSWVQNHLDSPIIVSAERKEFYKQPMFYVMGHFAKFVVEGSKRINVSEINRGVDDADIQNVAFLTPKNTVAVVLYNDGPKTTVGIQLEERHADVVLESDSIVTVEISYKLAL